MKQWLSFTLFAIAWSLPGWAASVLPMYLDDLTAESQTIVYGRVVASRTEWDQNRRIIYTIYTVVPTEYLKGYLGTTFELREPGGEIGGIVMHVPGVPKFSGGQEAVLFVWTDAAGRHQTSALEQGALKILTDPRTGIRQAIRGIRLGSARQQRAAGLSAAIALQRAAETGRSLPLLFQQIRLSVARTSSEAPDP